MNDSQLNDVSNQSQIFFVNVPQEQKNQQQQQVLPVTVVQQGTIDLIRILTYRISISF